jgi:hypothetical protein
LYDQIGKQCWNLDTIGDHTIKSECITIDKIIFSGVSVIALLLWKSLVPPKIEVFLWQLMHDNLCTKDFLAYKYIIESSSHMFLSNYTATSTIHLRFHCPNKRHESRVFFLKIILMYF